MAACNPEVPRIDANKDEPQIDADIRSPGRGLMKVEKLQGSVWRGHNCEDEVVDTRGALPRLRGRW
jgi:hypothetical protein